MLNFPAHSYNNYSNNNTNTSNIENIPLFSSINEKINLFTINSFNDELDAAKDVGVPYLLIAKVTSHVSSTQSAINYYDLHHLLADLLNQYDEKYNNDADLLPLVPSSFENKGLTDISNRCEITRINIFAVECFQVITNQNQSQYTHSFISQPKMISFPTPELSDLLASNLDWDIGAILDATNPYFQNNSQAHENALEDRFLLGQHFLDRQNPEQAFRWLTCTSERPLGSISNHIAHKDEYPTN